MGLSYLELFVVLKYNHRLSLLPDIPPTEL